MSDPRVDPFAGVSDGDIGVEVWRRLAAQIDGADISDWLLARGHGWTLSATDKADFAEVKPVGKLRSRHGGHTLTIRRGHDGTRRGAFVALFRCFESAVADLAAIRPACPPKAYLDGDAPPEAPTVAQIAMQILGGGG